MILRVLDAFRPRGATWSGQVISSPPGPSGGPSKTHLLPSGGVPRVHRARSPVPPRLSRFATPRSVHQFAAVAPGAYPPRRPPNAWSPGAPAPPGPCYWLVASGTPLGWREYQKEFGDIYKRLEKRLEPLLVNQDQWKREKSYLWHKDRIVVPSDRVPALLKWTHESSGHVGADRTLRLFKQWFHTTWTDDQLRKTLQPIVDKCPCRSSKPGDIRDRGLYSTLPIPHCANSVLYVDYTEMPKFGGYDFALVVTCGLSRFTRVFPCTKHITGEETIKIPLEEWFCVYGAPKEINLDEDVRVRSDTGW